MAGPYNAGQPASRTVLVNPTTLADVVPASAAADGATPIAGGNGTAVASKTNSTYVQPGSLTATTDRSGTATTTSGGLNVAANASRTFLVGQNIGAVNLGYNEQGGTAAIGTAGTYTVPPGVSFLISTNKLVNFICASSTCAVTLTEG